MIMSFGHRSQETEWILEKGGNFCRTMEWMILGQRETSLTIGSLPAKVCFPISKQMGMILSQPRYTSCFSFQSKQSPPLVAEKTMPAQRKGWLKVRIQMFVSLGRNERWLSIRTSHACNSILLKQETRFLHLNLVTFQYKKVCFLTKNVLKKEK